MRKRLLGLAPTVVLASLLVPSSLGCQPDATSAQDVVSPEGEAAPPVTSTRELHAAAGGLAAFGPSPYVARPRGTCLRVTGAVLGSETPVVDGVPQTIDASESCVESGHAGAVGGLVYTDKDNPVVWSKATLQRFELPTGARVPLGYLRDDTGYRVSHGDLDFAVTGGDQALAAPLLSVAATSLAATLRPWTAATGDWSAPNDLVAAAIGARLGRTPEEIGLQATGPTGGATMAAFPARVALDPNVLLVPVQAVLFYADDVADRLLVDGFLPSQLTLWDRVPTEGARAAFSDPDGTTGTAQLMARVVSLRGPAAMSGQRLPDDFWATCGIQFRLVNVMTIRVPKSSLSPTGHGRVGAVVEEHYKIISVDPRFQQHRLTTLFAPNCADVTSTGGGGGFQKPDGQALIGSDFACVRTGASSSWTLAHELGHVVLGAADHEPDQGATLGNLMNPVPPTSPWISAAQCRTARERLRERGLVMDAAKSGDLQFVKLPTK